MHIEGVEAGVYSRVPKKKGKIPFRGNVLVILWLRAVTVPETTDPANAWLPNQ